MGNPRVRHRKSVWYLAVEAVMPISGGRHAIAHAQSGMGDTPMIALTTCQAIGIVMRENVSVFSCAHIRFYIHYSRPLGKLDLTLSLSPSLNFEL